MRRGGGFTYLWLLWALALSAAGLAAAATAWHSRLAREREAGSIQRAREVVRALARWHAAAPGQPGPEHLEDLLADSRTGPLVRHLRRIPVDPLTRQADWELLRDAQGAIVGLRSRSTAPAWSREGLGPVPAAAVAASSPAATAFARRAESTVPHGVARPVASDRVFRLGAP